MNERKLTKKEQKEMLVEAKAFRAASVGAPEVCKKYFAKKSVELLQKIKRGRK